MVQYQLIILPDESYKRHSRAPYWPIIPGVNVPPQWRDVPTCIQKEWIQQLPEEGKTATIGGTLYTLEGDLLLPKGQSSHYVMSENDALDRWEAAQRLGELDMVLLRRVRQQNPQDVPLLRALLR